MGVSALRKVLKVFDLSKHEHSPLMTTILISLLDIFLKSIPQASRLLNHPYSIF
jgi:hypothetical protein